MKENIKKINETREEKSSQKNRKKKKTGRKQPLEETDKTLGQTERCASDISSELQGRTSACAEEKSKRIMGPGECGRQENKMANLCSLFQGLVRKCFNWLSGQTSLKSMEGGRYSILQHITRYYIIL